MKDCVRLASTVGLSKEDWLKIRKSGIGGSDMPAIIGVSEWATPLSVFYDKTDEEVKEIPDNPAMRWGRELEPLVAQSFAADHPTWKVKKINAVLRSKYHSFMLANIDRLVKDDDGDAILEIKTTRYPDKWKGDEPPIHVAAQMYHYMIVTGIRRAYCRVLIGGQEEREWRIDYDNEVAVEMMSLASQFWKLVKDGTPPEVTARDGGILGAKYNKGDNEEILNLPDLEGDCAEIDELETALEMIKDQIEERKNTIKAEMGDHQSATAGAYKLSWKVQTRNTIDSTKLKKDHPDIAVKYNKVGQSRPFLIKPIAKEGEE